MATITCKDCGFENEGERVYCHECGVKLERSILAEETKPTESPEQTQKRVHNLLHPPKHSFKRGVKSFFHALIWSIVVATVIQMLKPPDGLPKKDELIDTAQANLRDTLEEARKSFTTRSFVLTEQAINGYFQSAIKPKKQGSVSKFLRCFVNLEEGSCRITAEQAIFDYSIYIGNAYKLEVKGGKLESTLIAANVGRLPVHPEAMVAFNFIFKKLWEVLKEERNTLDEMQAVEVHKGEIILITKLRASGSTL